MSVYVPVPGTWSWKSGEWHTEGSPLALYLGSRGCHIANPKNPFVWTTELGGVGIFKSEEKKHADWIAAGINLFHYVVPPLGTGTLKPKDTNIIAHSHGLQVVLYACQNGLKVNTLISVGSPIREDLMDTAKRARPNIGYWEHFYSDKSDKFQILGALFDGKRGLVRVHPLADTNSFIAHVGHSDILNKPEHFRVWDRVATKMEQNQWDKTF